MQDYLTKYPEAIVVKNTAVKENIRVLEKVFGRHGYPQKVVTDNGPPWNGEDAHPIQQFLKWAGVEHDPTWSADDPEANGLAERLMQLVAKSWESAYVEGRNPLSALNTALKSEQLSTPSREGNQPNGYSDGPSAQTPRL